MTTFEFCVLLLLTSEQNKQKLCESSMRIENPQSALTGWMKKTDEK